MTDAKPYLSSLHDGRWFQTLPEGLRQALCDAAVVRRLPAGQRLF